MRALVVLLLPVPVAAALPATHTPVVAHTRAADINLGWDIVLNVDPTTRTGDLAYASALGQSYTKFPGMQHVGPFNGGECREDPTSLVECWIGDAPTPSAPRYVRLGADGSFEDWSRGFLDGRTVLDRVG